MSLLSTSVVNNVVQIFISTSEMGSQFWKLFIISVSDKAEKMDPPKRLFQETYISIMRLYPNIICYLDTFLPLQSTVISGGCFFFSWKKCLTEIVVFVPIVGCRHNLFFFITVSCEILLLFVFHVLCFCSVAHM